MKRPLQTLVPLLLIGLLTSVVLAWACALWSPMRDSRALTAPEADALLRAVASEAAAARAPQGVMNRGFGWAYAFAVDATIRMPAYTPADRHRSSGPAAPPLTMVPPSPDDRVVHVVTAGWPLACVTGERRRIGTWTRQSGMVEPPSMLMQLQVKPKRVLPIRPLWLGLVADCGLFAAGAWLVVPGPLALRRVLRRRGGRCPSCGYIVRHADHDACPECGAARG